MKNGMRGTDVSLLTKWVRFNGDAPKYVRKQGVVTDHIAPFPAKNGSLVESMLGKYIYRAHEIKGVTILFFYDIK